MDIRINPPYIHVGPISYSADIYNHAKKKAVSPIFLDMVKQFGAHFNGNENAFIGLYEVDSDYSLFIITCRTEILNPNPLTLIPYDGEYVEEWKLVMEHLYGYYTGSFAGDYKLIEDDLNAAKVDAEKCYGHKSKNTVSEENNKPKKEKSKIRRSIHTIEIHTIEIPDE